MNPAVFAGLRSLRIFEERIRELGAVRALAIVGATCVGKSTIVEAMRGSSLARDRLELPPRLLTRPPRGGDRATENIHLDADEFEARVNRGDVAFHWTRTLENGREERYAFPVIAPGRFAVFSANNALLVEKDRVRPADALDGVMLLAVDAPESVRAARLAARSPELLATLPGEAAHRLAESIEGVLGQVHAVLENHGVHQTTALADASRILEILLGIRDVS